MGAAGGRASSRAGVKNKRQFARMSCPYTHRGCRNRRGEVVESTVPGIKQHVRKVHGKSAARRIDWPPVHLHPVVKRLAAPGSLAAMSLNELRQAASKKGIDPRGRSKKDLARLLLRFAA